MKKKDKPLKFKKIVNYPTVHEAEMMAEILRKEGIVVLTDKGISAGIFGTVDAPFPTGVNLLVPEKDVERAFKILPHMKKGD